MKFRIVHIIFFAFLAVFLTGCNRKSINERITLAGKDKIPYGAYYAYENLRSIFPDASVEVVEKSPASTNSYKISGFGALPSEAERSLYLIISPAFVPGEKELESIMTFIGNGNHVFISAMEIGSDFLDTLGLKTAFPTSVLNRKDSLSVTIEDPLTGDYHGYVYPGMRLDNHFTEYDSSYTTVLGYNETGDPDFVQFRYENGGSLFVQVAPAAFSNFFLLHKDNSNYYNQALSFLPKDLYSVYWDDYFRYHRLGSDKARDNFSKLRMFMEDRILKWPFWLVLILFALIYIFESKRKQRIVPERQAPKNASLEFVKTIGRLYHQRHDNKDLSNKMTVHFLDYVRTRYNIPTRDLQEGFISRLAFKSGYDAESIEQIVYIIKYFQDFPEVTDEQLMDFHQRLDKFYKQG